jgi:hypothetical protein
MNDFLPKVKKPRVHLQYTRVLHAETFEEDTLRVSIFVSIRPEDKASYLAFFTEIASDFCKEYNCDYAGGLDVEFNPMNESSVLRFNVNNLDRNKVSDD